MKTYVVGGAVRDALLGRPVSDRDHVVVGATPEQMSALGFKPVGSDFPVFLHPQSREEYALARTERKTAVGYKGFAIFATPEVTLEEDLARRDLTINAMAFDEAGRLIDPYGGAADLRAGVLRHVSPAFVEDPVRILRVARFAARFGFSVAPETLALMRAMVANGEADALVPERVWQELARGMMESRPSRMLAVLAECGALQRIAPQLAGSRAEGTAGEIPSWQALDRVAAHQAPLPVRFAALAGSLSAEQIASLSSRLRVPADCRDLALLVSRYGEQLRRANDLAAGEVLDLLQTVDAMRRPQRFAQLLQAIEAMDESGRSEEHTARLRRALAAAASVNAGAVAAGAADPNEIPSLLLRAREAAIREISTTPP